MNLASVVIGTVGIVGSQHKPSYKFAPPDESGPLAFLRKIPMKGEPSWNPVEEYLPVYGKDRVVYRPGWAYHISIPVSKVAQILKQNLTKKGGWTLSFPRPEDDWQLTADHMGKADYDWILDLERPSKLSALIIYDRSRSLPPTKHPWDNEFASSVSHRRR